MKQFEPFYQIKEKEYERGLNLHIMAILKYQDIWITTD